MSNESSEEWPEGDYVAGGLYLGTAVLGLAGYIPVLSVVVRTKEMISQPFDKFLVSLGISDCIALLAWLLTAVHILRHGEFLSPELQAAVNCTILFAWYKLVAELALIAFNRYCCALKPKWRIRFFGAAKSPWIWIGVTVGTSALITLTPVFCCENYIDVNILGPSTWCVGTAGNVFLSMDMTLNTFSCIVSILCYAIIMKEARASARRVAAHSNTASKGNQIKPNDVKFDKRQAKLAVQAVFISLFFYYQSISYYTYYIFGGFTSSRMGNFFVSNLPWILNFALNPFIYLIFNGGLRAEFRKRLGCGNV